MSHLRYNIQYAFEEPISPTLQGKLTALENILKDVGKDAVKINEEDTTKATKHICLHGTSGNKVPCVEIEI